MLLEMSISRRRSTAYVAKTKRAWRDVKRASFLLEHKATLDRRRIEGCARDVRRALEEDASASVIIEFTEVGKFGKRTIRFV